MRVVVLGYIVRGPLGGALWHHLQYVLGLHRLGHDVYFLEDSGDSPWCCYHQATHLVDADPGDGLEFARRAFERYDLDRRWAYYDAHTQGWLGPAAGSALDVLASADVLLNLSGVNPLRPWSEDIPVRAFVDTDPAFTQVRHLIDPGARRLAAGHTAFFTFGENLPAGRSTIPDDGFPWVATRQPVVLDAWPVRPAPATGRFTTVMTWESYPALEFDGVRYGLKSDSFGPYLGLPEWSPVPLEIALGGSTAPHGLLRKMGWHIRSPMGPSRDGWTYQRYLSRSRGEFTIAKEAYVTTASGWFSERSVNYLASGRPVVTQATGFEGSLPVGEGLIAFSSPAQAIAALGDVASRYVAHARAAREIADAHFDSDRVLNHLLEAAFRPVGALR